MFIPTVQEINLLKLLQDKDSVSKQQLSQIYPYEQTWQRALEGCLSKGFVKMNDAGNIKITTEGLNCI